MRISSNGCLGEFAKQPLPLPLRYVSPVAKLPEAAFRHQSKIQCTIAAVAVERFRLARGRWPKDLQEVVDGKLLPHAPLDCYRGRPLQFRKAKGDYRGDALDMPPDERAGMIRYEFRLWDVEHRAKAQP